VVPWQQRDLLCFPFVLKAKAHAAAVRPNQTMLRSVKYDPKTHEMAVDQTLLHDLPDAETACHCQFLFAGLNNQIMNFNMIQNIIHTSISPTTISQQKRKRSLGIG
jgi:hypothetical protein